MNFGAIHSICVVTAVTRPGEQMGVAFGLVQQFTLSQQTSTHSHTLAQGHWTVRQTHSQSARNALAGKGTGRRADTHSIASNVFLLLPLRLLRAKYPIG